MPGKRLRLVRSSTSFDDMSVLNEPLPPPELRMKMNPPRYPAKILIEGDNVPQLAILTLPSPYMRRRTIEDILETSWIDVTAVRRSLVRKTTFICIGT
ncbi:hypothetical protein C1H46_024589 [Malus baccata]|uniref:Uncharacterized protein n=1 Tax=Malus baccata TaxID=106549 RepID=A0A540LTH5_MALBA|nr:hypothetical protein C1H46_024589 [Malus baccata]